MEYYIYNAIKTPDGTVLCCRNGHDFQQYVDSKSGEVYMNDGLGYGVRRSINKVPYEDLSLTTSSDFKKLRCVQFWRSYGKDGKGAGKMMSLSEMEDSHIEAIIQMHIEHGSSSPVTTLFFKEQSFRLQNNLTKTPLKENSKKLKV